jgi:hypothetical protein
MINGNTADQKTNHTEAIPMPVHMMITGEKCEIANVVNRGDHRLKNGVRTRKPAHG